MAEKYDEAKLGGEMNDSFVINEFRVLLGDKSISFQIDFSGPEPLPPYTNNHKILKLVGPVLDEKGYLNEDGHLLPYVRCLMRAREIYDGERQLVITYLKKPH